MDNGHLPSLQELQTLVPCAPTRTWRTQGAGLQSHRHPFLALLGMAGRAWAWGGGGACSGSSRLRGFWERAPPPAPGVPTTRQASFHSLPASGAFASVRSHLAGRQRLCPGVPAAGTPSTLCLQGGQCASQSIRRGLIGPLSRKQRLLQERRHDLNVPDPEHCVRPDQGDGAALGHPRGRGSTEGSRGSCSREAALKISAVFSADKSCSWVCTWLVVLPQRPPFCSACTRLPSRFKQGVFSRM